MENLRSKHTVVGLIIGLKSLVIINVCLLKKTFCYKVRFIAINRAIKVALDLEYPFVVNKVL